MNFQKTSLEGILLGVCGAATGLIVGFILASLVTSALPALIVLVFGLFGLSLGTLGALYRVLLLQARAAAEITREKNTFITMVLHYIRTPLTGTKWKLSELEANGKKVEWEDLEIVSEDTERALRASDRLLEAAQASDKQLAYALEPVPASALAELVRDVAQRHQKLFEEKKLDYKEAIAELPAAEVRIDKEKIRFALTAILENALKYSDEGTTVRLSMRVQAGRIVIDIANRGIGIPTKDQSKIFLQFFRGSNAYLKEADGFGIDLFMAQLFVKRHGGTIVFSSREKQETVFSVYLPVF